MDCRFVYDKLSVIYFATKFMCIKNHLKRTNSSITEMGEKDKCRHLKHKDVRKPQDYMYMKSLADSRLEFLWQTDMIETRATMKGKNPKNQYSCPHCSEGRSVGAIESPSHLLVCSAYFDLRQGLDAELVVSDRATYLRRVIIRRKELEQELRK